MDINKGLLFFDGTTLTASTAATGKTLDLGFSGDFDYKNFLWNRIFVSMPAKASANDVTLKVYARQDGVPTTADDTYLIASLTIPAAKVVLGAPMVFNCPTGLKRYVLCTITPGAVAPSKVTCGFTQDVDTDCIALGGGIDWTNYKAATLDTAITGTPMQNIAEVIANGAGDDE